MCQADPDLLGVLETMNFPTIWPYYPTRAEAIQAAAKRHRSAVAVAPQLPAGES
jgi:hypothetical protein